ncbi:MAG: hypothetical protein JW987_11695 [Anaerolineaceae bacterium]|nr:hypothetical protein [Anaerolineaceae bacterium]
MKIENKIYFAPGIEFKAVDWYDPPGLLNGFVSRVYAYYIDPARNMAKWLPLAENNPSIVLGIAFGCGVISCTTIDFLARVELQKDAVRERYIEWLVNWICGMKVPDPDATQRTTAERFYDEFRNGLVHEGRVKEAGQFSLDADTFASVDQIFTFVDHAMVVNPFNLLNAIEAALHQYQDKLLNDKSKLEQFAVFLRTVFQADIDYANRN